MGQRGIVPKRSAEKLGHRTQAEKDRIAHVTVDGIVDPPPALKSWHPRAIALYESLMVPEQAQFMQPSDWAAAQDAAETLSRAYSTNMGVLFIVADKKWDRLLVTEAARRRAGIEIERRASGEGAQDAPASSDHRARLSVVS